MPGAKRTGLHRAQSALVLIWLAATMCGCETAQYYQQAIKGQTEILLRREPLDALRANPATPAQLRQQFELVLELRAFAQRELQLPIDAHYLTYVDLGRRFAVWNVHAAREFSLQPRQWWYPFVGSLKYRGYFSEEHARRYARELAAKGEDVYVEGVEAYSTLGWFADPLLNTFIQHAKIDLAEIIFHELAHQRLFLSGDTDFNEAFATAVAEEGVRRWLTASHQDDALKRYLEDLQRNRDFVALVLATRRKLERLYGEEDESTDRPSKTAQRRGRVAASSAQAQWRTEKQAILENLRREYATLKGTWQGYAGYDAWFARELNNAQLNTIAVYYELVPGFEALLTSHDGDLDAFYRYVEDMRPLDKEERQNLLRALGQFGPSDRGYSRSSGPRARPGSS